MDTAPIEWGPIPGLPLQAEQAEDVPMDEDEASVDDRYEPEVIPGLRIPRERETVLPGLRANDAATDIPYDRELPIDEAQGKSHARSLMQPQELAWRLLPADVFRKLFKFAKTGCPAECGPEWKEHVIKAAMAAGPHVSAMTDDNVLLIWEDVTYQSDAGFVRIVTASDLFGDNIPPGLKFSRVAVVPQANRRGRIILNLSAEVDLGYERLTGRRRKRKLTHPSVNETTEPAEDQKGVKELGTAVRSLLLFMFETDCEWEIDWQKIDLSDGFWRMIVEAGKEYNFVYQLPRRPGDTEDHFVVPSSLQMGWKNSPAYFCTATEAGRILLKRILALTVDTGIDQPHRHEAFCRPAKIARIEGPTPQEAPKPWRAPVDLVLLNRVYIDDYMNGLAGPRGRKRKREEQEWVARGTLHSIHGIFPTPEVLQHEGGRDSVSERKLEKGDARFKPDEVMLGFLLDGRFGRRRLVALPRDKKDRYRSKVQDALSKPRNYISFNEFQKIHGKLEHAAVAMPCMRGFMTPLNRVLGSGVPTVGLGKASVLREVFERFDTLLELAHTKPSHITEIVPPDLPHYYGTVDACAVGIGGVWLPCTRWLQPVVWRMAFPADVERAVREGTLTMADCESIGYFVGECFLDHLVEGDTAGVSSHLESDNKVTCGRVGKQSSQAESRLTERMLRLLAMRQRWTRRGPQDINYWMGDENKMADIPSRSFEEGFPAGKDDAFLAMFANKFPLPPQLGSWRIVRPPTGIVCAAISLLRNHNDTEIHPATATGELGVGLPVELANTLFSLESRKSPTVWNEDTCSWPLLTPYGAVSSTMDSRLRERQSRRRFNGCRYAWTSTDLRTLGEQIRVSTDSTVVSERS